MNEPDAGSNLAVFECIIRSGAVLRDSGASGRIKLAALEHTASEVHWIVVGGECQMGNVSIARTVPSEQKTGLAPPIPSQSNSISHCRVSPPCIHPCI